MSQAFGTEERAIFRNNKILREPGCEKRRLDRSQSCELE